MKKLLTLLLLLIPLLSTANNWNNLVWNSGNWSRSSSPVQVIITTDTISTSNALVTVNIPQQIGFVIPTDGYAKIYVDGVFLTDMHTYSMQITLPIGVSTVTVELVNTNGNSLIPKNETSLTVTIINSNTPSAVPIPTLSEWGLLLLVLLLLSSVYYKRKLQ